MSKLKELLSLLWIKFHVSIYNTIEYMCVIKKYYPNALFAKIDISLLSHYLFTSPFTVSKRFLTERGEEDVFAYGETPLTTLETITRHIDLAPSDVVYELGCGRGRTCFWLHCFAQCRVIGIDYVPTFINHAESVKKRFKLTGVDFYCIDIMEAELADATVIYLYGSNFEGVFIRRLATRFHRLPKGTKIVTTSYSLNDYCETKSFKQLAVFPAKYPWGTTSVYLQTVR